MNIAFILTMIMCVLYLSNKLRSKWVMINHLRLRGRYHTQTMRMTRTRVGLLVTVLGKLMQDQSGSGYHRRRCRKGHCQLHLAHVRIIRSSSNNSASNNSGRRHHRRRRRHRRHHHRQHHKEEEKVVERKSTPFMSIVGRCSGFPLSSDTLNKPH